MGRSIYDVEQEKKRLGPNGPMQVTYRRLEKTPADIATRGGLVLSPPHFSDDKWQWTCDLYFAGPMWKPWALKDVAFFQGSSHTSPPRFSDVVECLLLDALGVVDTTFEDWANEYGYSADSIKARDIYLACVNTRGRLAPVMRDYEQMQHAQPDLDVESYCHNQWATLATYQR